MHDQFILTDNATGEEFLTTITSRDLPETWREEFHANGGRLSTERMQALLASWNRAQVAHRNEVSYKLAHAEQARIAWAQRHGNDSGFDPYAGLD